MKDTLIFPREVLRQHACVLGKTGSGKSSALRYIVEHLLDQDKRVCIIDPKGDWAGIKAMADGKTPGYPVIGFGDFKESKGQDVPINDRSGKHIAELIATGNRPCVIGFRGWMTGQMVRFWIDFASTLFNSNAGELYLVIDESHNFAPKGKILDPEAGKCLHWTNRLMSEGRGYGLVCLIASQRPQKVHNDTLTCCETLVAMRVIHKADRDAIEDWIDGCGDPAKGLEILNALAGMPRGEAYVWSPEIHFGPKRLSFPMFKTFDSFAPPQLQKAVSASGWSAVDLTAVKQKLESVIEEHKANDPAELKREITRLRRELEAKPKSEPVVREVRRFTPEDLGLIEDLSGKMATLEWSLEAIKEKFTAISCPSPHRTPAPAPKPPKLGFVPKPVSPAPGGPALGKCARAILTTLLQCGEPMAKNRIAITSGYSLNSSSFANALGELRSASYIAGSDPITVTPEGQNALPDYEPLPRGRALREYWLGRLGKCSRSLLGALIDAYPAQVDKETLAERTGYSVTSSSFANALGELRTLELIDRQQSPRATDALFEE